MRHLALAAVLATAYASSAFADNSRPQFCGSSGCVSLATLFQREFTQALADAESRHPVPPPALDPYYEVRGVPGLGTVFVVRKGPQLYLRPSIAGQWFAAPQANTYADLFAGASFVKAFARPAVTQVVISGSTHQRVAARRWASIFGSLKQVPSDFAGIVSPLGKPYVVNFSPNSKNPWTADSYVVFYPDRGTILYNGRPYSLPKDLVAQLKGTLGEKRQSAATRSGADPGWQLLVLALVLLAVAAWQWRTERAQTYALRAERRRRPWGGFMVMVAGFAFIVISLETWTHPTLPVTVGAFASLTGAGQLFGQDRLTYWLTLLSAAVACGAFLGK